MKIQFLFNLLISKYAAASHTNERDWDHDHHRQLGLSPKSRSITMSPSAKLGRNSPFGQNMSHLAHNGHNGHYEWGAANYGHANGHHHPQSHHPQSHGHNGRNGRNAPNNRYTHQSGMVQSHQSHHQTHEQLQRGTHSNRSERSHRKHSHRSNRSNRGNRGNERHSNRDGQSERHSERHLNRDHHPQSNNMTTSQYTDNNRLRVNRRGISDESEIYEQYGGDINAGDTDTASMAPSFAAGGHGPDGRRLPSRMSGVTAVAKGTRFRFVTVCKLFVFVLVP